MEPNIAVLIPGIASLTDHVDENLRFKNPDYLFHRLILTNNGIETNLAWDLELLQKYVTLMEQHQDWKRVRTYEKALFILTAYKNIDRDVKEFTTIYHQWKKYSVFDVADAFISFGRYRSKALAAAREIAKRDSSEIATLDKVAQMCKRWEKLLQRREVDDLTNTREVLNTIYYYLQSKKKW